MDELTFRTRIKSAATKASKEADCPNIETTTFELEIHDSGAALHPWVGQLVEVTVRLVPSFDPPQRDPRQRTLDDALTDSLVSFRRNGGPRSGDTVTLTAADRETIDRLIDKAAGTVEP